MMKILENNGTEEISLVTPTPGLQVEALVFYPIRSPGGCSHVTLGYGVCL